MTSVVNIHPTAIVDSKAKIGNGVTIGAYSIIGPKVELGDNCWVGPHVVIEGITRFGSANKIFQFASVGSQPQDLKYHGEESTVDIGDNNTIREYVTIQPGTKGGGMTTKIGNNNLLMANSHVGHDSFLGDRNIIANSVGLSGHVTVGSGVTIGGLSGIHQFVRLGDLSFIAGGAMITQDLPPYCTAHGNRAELVGLNQIGLERNGFTELDVKVLRKVYRVLFHDTGLMKDRIVRVRNEFGSAKGIEPLLSFIAESQRGVCRARSKGSSEE